MVFRQIGSVLSSTVLKMLSTLITFVVITSLLAQKITSSGTGTDLCASQATCSECIQIASCTWCMEPSMDNNNTRCYSSSASPSYCREEYKWNPTNEETLWYQRKLSRPADYVPGEERNLVLFSPQNISLKLRINETHRFRVQYSQAQHYPLDVYILMDMSKSMEIDKEKVFSLVDSIAQEITNVTLNFRIGFGSFGGKAPSSSERFCAECDTPYTFQNHLPLTSDLSSFSEKLRQVRTSETNGSGEGFNALSQALLCDQIRWRIASRKILIFATNSDLYWTNTTDSNATIRRHDGRCHLDSSGRYTHSELQNSPTIEQIDRYVRRRAINVVFAAASAQLGSYHELSNQIMGSSTGLLTDDSSNVVELIRHQYNFINSYVELKESASYNVEIGFSSSCLGYPQSTQANKCEGIKVGDVVTFVVEIQLKTCPENQEDWKERFFIYPVGLNDRLTIDLNMLCGCPFKNVV